MFERLRKAHQPKGFRICRHLSVFVQLKAGPFEESQIATMLKEILKGLDYLHSEKKIHRDIKGVEAAGPTGSIKDLKTNISNRNLNEEEAAEYGDF